MRFLAGLALVLAAIATAAQTLPRVPLPPDMRLFHGAPNGSTEFNIRADVSIRVRYDSGGGSCRFDISPLTTPADWPNLREAAIPRKIFDGVLDEIAPAGTRGKLRVAGNFSAGFRWSQFLYDNILIETREIFDDNQPHSEVVSGIATLTRPSCFRFLDLGLVVFLLGDANSNRTIEVRPDIGLTAHYGDNGYPISIDIMPRGWPNIRPSEMMTLDTVDSILDELLPFANYGETDRGPFGGFQSNCAVATSWKRGNALISVNEFACPKDRVMIEKLTITFIPTKSLQLGKP
jgi:hypothetical protein